MSRENKQKKLKRRRERGQLHSRVAVHPVSEPQVLRLLSYDIVSEPGHPDVPTDQNINLIDPARLDAVGALLYDDPAKAIEPIRQLLDEYPRTQTLTQWLASALALTDQTEAADRLIKLNYRDHPDYLFARLDYIKLLLRRGELSQAEQLLDRKFELKLMYPLRNTFHLSEVMAFNSLMVEFFIRKGELEVAKLYLESLEKLESDHPLTEECRHRLESALLLQKLKQGILGFGRPKR
jgi:hypothetical protein